MARVRSLYRDGLAAWRAQTPATRGALLMCLSTVAFSIMHASIRHVSAELDPLQIAFFRNLFGLVFLAPLLVGAGWAQMRTERLGLHALRGLVNVFAMFLFFYALATAPLAKVTALGFTAPIFTAVLAVFFLGERFRLRRWTAIVVGFIGMLIIIRPGVTTVDAGALMALASAMLWAVALIFIKVLSRTETSVAIVAWMGIFLCAFSVVPAVLVWRWPAPETWLWLAMIGCVGSIAQVSLSQSLKETDPTAVLPFDFLKLVWTALIGAWFFAEIPDRYTWIGAAVIFSAGIYIAHRERAAQRREAADP